MSEAVPDPKVRGIIVSAELAVAEQEYDTAEEALLKALGRVRKVQGGQTDA